VARLCILSEDFVLESKAVIEASLPNLDGISPEWRKNYFIRNSFRTIHEIKKGIETVRLDPTFKTYFEKQRDKDKLDFEEHFRILRNVEKTLKNIRDELGGGHVLPKAVKKGIENLDPSEEGLMQAGETLKNSHLMFVHKIVSGYLRSQLTDGGSRTTEEAQTIFLEKVTNAFSSALTLVHTIFYIYLVERRLVP
jgi:phage-related protein